MTIICIYQNLISKYLFSTVKALLKSSASCVSPTKKMSIYCFITIVVCLIGSILAEDLKLLILHNNDIHARFEETARDSNLNSCKEKTSRTGRSQSRGCVGGIARTAHEIRRYRKMAERGQVPPVLYLYAGDTYFEAECSGEQKAKKCVEFLNILEPNATV